MEVKGVDPVVSGVNSGDGTPLTTTSPHRHSTQGTGRQPSHIQYERGAVEIRSRGDGDDCGVFEVLCGVFSWLSSHGAPQPIVTATESDPFGPPRRTGSSYSPTTTTESKSTDPITSGPPQPGPSTTPLTTTSQSGEPENTNSNPHAPPYSASQPTTIGAPTESEPSAATSIALSNDGDINTYRSLASNSISTVTSPSGGATSAESPPQILPPYIMHPSPSGPPLLFPSPSLQTPSNPPRPLSTGAIIGIAFGALAAVMCTALALFFLVRRRARRRSKRMSIESSLRHLEPHSYDDGPSLSPVSSVWTGFGSVSVDPDFEPQSEPSAHSLDFQFAEKHASFQRSEGCAPSPSLSPCPSTSPALAETQPLARGMSPLPLAPSHDDLHLSHLLGVPSPAPGALSFPNLLALARTDYPGVANPLNHGGPVRRSVSGVSHTTVASSKVQSVEAL